MVASPQLFTHISQFHRVHIVIVRCTYCTTCIDSCHESHAKNVPNVSSIGAKSGKQLNVMTRTKKRIIWDSQKRDEFVRSIDTKVQEIVQTLIEYHRH